MNSEVLKQVLDKLSSIEKRLQVLEMKERNPMLVVDPSYWQTPHVNPDKCLHDGLHPGVPVSISCNCPRCSSYSISLTNGDSSKFTSGSIGDNVPNDYCHKEFMETTYPNHLALIECKCDKCSYKHPTLKDCVVRFGDNAAFGGFPPTKLVDYDGRNGNGYQPTNKGRGPANPPKER